MKIKNNKKSIFAILLSLVMIVTMAPLSVFADEIGDEVVDSAEGTYYAYTDVGPFLDAVKVEQKTKMRTFALNASNNTQTAAENTPAQSEGLVTNKSVRAGENPGEYILTLEAYATGEKVTTTVTKSTPCDIVLVLDFSKSMSLDFGSSNRLLALQSAVNNFIDQTRSKYDATTSDHRIAIVTYNTGAAVRNQLTPVEADNVNDLKITGTKTGGSSYNTEYNGELNDWSQSGTETGEGVKAAENLLTATSAGGSYEYSGSNTTRQKVVVLFTDGQPDSDETTREAVESAKKIKDMGATVYTVAVYEGANPEATLDDTPSSGSDEINALLHAVSSNYKYAEVELVEEESSGGGNSWWPGGWGDSNTYLQYTFGTGSNNGYYLTADDPESLNNIFTSISQNIESGGSSVTLDETAVVKDVISDQFELPEGVNATNTERIKVYTEDYTAENTFTNRKPFDGDISISGKTISVTNFDFAENYVGVNKTNGVVTSYHGKKLIIEIPIKPTPDFIGGNGVYTNGVESGVYDGNGTVVENFNRPTVDIKVVTIDATAENQNIYLTESVDLSKVIGTVNVTVNGINNAYADITYTVYDGETLIATYVVEQGNTTGTWTYTDDYNLAVDSEKTFIVKYEVDGTNLGAINVATDEATANVNVFKPEITFNDGNVYLGGTTPSEYVVKDHVANVVWKNGEDVAPESMGTAPTLSYEFNNVNTEVTSTEDILVNAIVKIGDTDVTNHVVGDNPGFKLHVFSPYIQFSDSNVYYGNNIPTEFAGNIETVVWKRGDVLDTSVTMLGTKPNVTYTYDTSVDGAINTTADIIVNVNAKAGNIAINQDNFSHVACGDSEILPEGAEFLLHVLTPSVNFKDSYVYYGDNAPSNFDANTGTVTWGKDGIKAPTTIGNNPEVTMNYNYINTNDVIDGIIKVREDIPVNVIAKAGEVEFPVDSIGHINCDDATTEERVADAEFELHVKTCTLNITKNGILDVDHHAAGNGSKEERQTSLFDIYKDNETQPFMTVAINGNTADGEPETITGLPVGKYTVVERTDWSWRYKPSYNPDNVTLKATKDTDTVNVINIRFTKDPSSVGWKWLNGGAYCENAFNAYGTTNKSN